MPERRRNYDETPPEVKYGLLSKADYDALGAAMAAGDLLSWAKIAVPLCEDNVPLFGVLFLKKHPMPHIWREWEEIQKYPRILIRLPRGHAKTDLFTFTTLVHRIAYSVIPGSKHEDPRVLAIFEDRKRANDRMKAVMQVFETGGPGGLIGAIFRGSRTFAGGEPTPWADMGIVEIAKKFGEWNNGRINLPHPRRMAKPDPNVASITPNEGSVGFHPRVILGDDIVGEKAARSEAKRKALSAWWAQAIGPMIKPYTRVWLPHTVYHRDDLNREIELTNTMYLMRMDALDRFPSAEDFREVRDEKGVLVGVELTPEGEKLKPLWGCPEFSEAECPAFDPSHVDPAVGGIMHRPVKDLILQWKTRPMFFAQQFMHVIRNTDLTSVPEWMLRFFCSDPNCPDLWKPSAWHVDWEDWRIENPDAGLSKVVPHVVLFTKDGLQLEKGGDVSPIDRAVHGWDLAFGRHRTNDRTVCARMFRTKDRHFLTIFEKGRWRHDQVWRKVVLHAVTDPFHKPDEVALEVDAEQIYPLEVKKLMREMKVEDRFRLTEITRTKDKDTEFQNSGLPVTMSNGFFFVDHHDDDAIRELLAVTPDQQGGHDDCLDAAVNAYRRLRQGGGVRPGFFGKPLPAR